MPLVRDDEVFLIHSTLPTKIFAYNDGEIDSQGLSDFDLGRLRGGSQAVQIPDGRLFVVHDVTWRGQARTYLHRFVLMSEDFCVLKMSEPFYFIKHGIEFCAGLAYDGKRLVASFGVDDREAHLGTFELDGVLAKLRSDFVV
jgi:hypothetical protein